MNRYLPQYKDIYIRHGEIGVGMRFKGEYRAILKGPDDRVKSDTGWKPNTLLNSGLLNLRGDGYTWYYMSIGDSDIPVDITQVGLQGTSLFTNYLNNGGGQINHGAPLYQRESLRVSTFSTGQGTGTIREFVCGTNQGNGGTVKSTVRCVLDAPIVKGELDELTIWHRMTWYPELNDATGVIDISGELYNYTLRHTYIGGPVSSHPTNVSMKSNAVCYSTEIGANTGYPSGSYFEVFHSSVRTTGGSLGSYYYEAEYIGTIDQGNTPGTIRSIAISMPSMGASNPSIGMQCRLGKVSDDTVLQKLNTHEVRFTLRTYPLRYIP